MPRHYQPFVSQIAPTLATLPNFAAELTKPAAPAIVLRYSQCNLVAQVRPTLGTLPNLAADLTKPAAGAIVLRYAPPDFVTQVRPTLAMLPRIVAGTADPAPNAQPLRYDVGSFCAPAKFNISVPATVFEPGWFSTDGKPEIALSYARGDIFTAPAKTLPPAAITLSCWSPTPGQNAQPLDYDRGSFVAPDKSGITTPAIVFLPGWTQPDPLPMVRPTFTLADIFTAPAKTLPPAAVTLSCWTPTPGQNAQPLDYDRGSFSAPDKFGIIAPALVLVTSWTQPEPLPISSPKFSQGQSFAAPEKVLTAAGTLPSISAWTSTDARPAIKMATTAADPFTAPGKAIPAVVAPSWIAGWTANPGRTAFNRYTQAEPFSWRIFMMALPGPFVGVERGFAMQQSLAASQAITVSGLAARGCTTLSTLSASGFAIIVKEW
jgi:hypothetical protein